MKKLMSLMALAVVASVVAASAQEVLSANAVGYVKRTVPAKGFQIIAIPFDNIANADGTYKFGDTQVAQDAPQGSSVMFWDAEKQVWAPGTRGPKGWSAGDSNHVVAVGEAFFLKNNSTSNFEVTVAGEVPADETLERGYAGNGKAFAVAASAYPVDVKFGDTTLAAQLTQGSAVMFWDDAKQVWSPGTRGPKGWSAGDSNRVVKAGEGFFIRAAQDGTWKATKPYTWP